MLTEYDLEKLRDLFKTITDDATREALRTAVTEAQRDTLVEARSKLLEAIDDPSGALCPCCGLTAARRWIKLDSNMTMFLLSLIREHNRTGDWVHYDQCRYKGRNYPWLAHWKLIEDSSNDDSKKRRSGLWRPTDKGISFAHGNLRVPSKVQLYGGRVQQWGDELVDVHTTINNAFDYQEILHGGPR